MDGEGALSQYRKLRIRTFWAVRQRFVWMRDDRWASTTIIGTNIKANFA